MPVSILLSLLVFFNFFDAGSTLWVLNNHLGTELNPIMRYAYNLSPWAFLAVKVLTTTVSSMAIYRNQGEKYVQVAGYVVTSCYCCLFLYQVTVISWYLLWP